MLKKVKKYKAVIIGCGAIAGGYDEPADKNILTHAHALTIHKKTVLSGVYDISYNRAKLFARKWNSAAFTNLKAMLIRIKPEIIYICTPDEKHLQMLEIVSAYQPRIVICEKPLGSDIKKTKMIIRKYKKRRISLLVNYTRRFDYVNRKLREDIRSGSYGSFINASVIYTKGILHNGSHAIDLLRYFLGGLDSYEVFSGNIDYKKTDPTIDAFLKFKNNAKAHLIAGDEREYSIFELDLLFSKKRIILDNFGLTCSVQGVRKDPIFYGHNDLGPRKTKATGLNQALLKLVDNAIQHIEKKTELLCPAEEALKTQEICIKLLERYRGIKKTL